ncbi:E3 ubiquitin-protein ligase HERC2 [Merluccius polli]|uniref:E3 ubiquitin-protein ligase HERC2 n=1 Tax=Merluccius polli TaxID=89951 RepID=A0AA47NWR2_MERPO|nr:E3 ubiquitin-protein ligase HERC2 [Merluccius polli]
MHGCVDACVHACERRKDSKASEGCSVCAGWLRLQQPGEGRDEMPSPSFTLDAQLRFHDKWLKIDLQRGLSEMWNEMVKDEEITFTGGRVSAPHRADFEMTFNGQSTSHLVVT